MPNCLTILTGNIYIFFSITVKNTNACFVIICIHVDKVSNLYEYQAPIQALVVTVSQTGYRMLTGGLRLLKEL